MSNAFQAQSGARNGATARETHSKTGESKRIVRAEKGLEKDARKRADERDRQTRRLSEEEGRTRERKGAGRVAYAKGEGAANLKIGARGGRESDWRRSEIKDKSLREDERGRESKSGTENGGGRGGGGAGARGEEGRV